MSEPTVYVSETLFYAAMGLITGWLSTLSVLFVRLVWQSGNLEAGHKAILEETKAIRRILDPVTTAVLIGNAYARQPRQKQGNGDE